MKYPPRKPQILSNSQLFRNALFSRGTLRTCNGLSGQFFFILEKKNAVSWASLIFQKRFPDAVGS